MNNNIYSKWKKRIESQIVEINQLQNDNNYYIQTEKCYQKIANTQTILNNVKENKILIN